MVCLFESEKRFIETPHHLQHRAAAHYASEVGSSLSELSAPRQACPGPQRAAAFRCRSKASLVTHPATDSLVTVYLELFGIDQSAAAQRKKSTN
jgi:hypothetical protein